MVIAQAYATINHDIIADRILDIYKGINRSAKLSDTIRTSHNYIDFRDHIIRKGAINASSGRKIIIPFNMRDGIAICTGLGNEDWNYTAPHGAGRVMSRAKAKELITLDEYKESMTGIYTTSVNHSTIDESPMAYKDYKEILSLISPTAKVEFLIKPKINIKSGEE